MEELFAGYQAVTPLFEVIETDKKGRPLLKQPENAVESTEQDAGGGGEQGVRKRLGTNRERRGRGKEMDPREEKTVFVGNLPPSITRRKLKQLFGQKGKVESVRLRSMVVEKGKLPVRIAKRKQTQMTSSAINSYVVFSEKDAAGKALDLNGALVGDRHIRVDMATGGKEHTHDRSVFVGGLPYAVDDEEFREAFEIFGEVEAVRVIRERITGIGKGFGFVTFRDKSGVMFALQNNKKTEVKGQRVRITRSQDMSRSHGTSSAGVAKFSGIQAKSSSSGVRIGTARVRRNTNGEVKTSGPSIARGLELSNPTNNKMTESKLGGAVGRETKTTVAVGGVRPSRTFHKKKEARKREREEMLSQKKKPKQLGQ